MDLDMSKQWHMETVKHANQLYAYTYRHNSIEYIPAANFLYCQLNLYA